MTTLLTTKKNGISMLETMVVIGIMTLMLGVITSIFILNYDIVQKQSGRINTDTGATLAIKQIAEAARGATAVITTPTVIDGTSYSTSSTTLVIKTPSLDASKNIIAGQFDFIAIYRHPTETTKIFTAAALGTGSTRPSAAHLITAYNQTMYFRFNNPDPALADRVSMYLVNQQTVKGTTLTTKAWNSLFLRNYE